MFVWACDSQRAVAPRAGFQPDLCLLSVSASATAVTWKRSIKGMCPAAAVRREQARFFTSRSVLAVLGL